jgi:hypothetical protein
LRSIASAATRARPLEIAGHLGDLLEWGVALAQGEWTWKAASTGSWDGDVERFFDALAKLDARLASPEPLGHTERLIFQGPIADALTHVGQLAMLRRLAGAPVRPESFAKAEITSGRVGRSQSSARREFERRRREQEALIARTSVAARLPLLPGRISSGNHLEFRAPCARRLLVFGARGPYCRARSSLTTHSSHIRGGSRAHLQRRLASRVVLEQWSLRQQSKVVRQRRQYSGDDFPAERSTSTVTHARRPRVPTTMATYTDVGSGLPYVYRKVRRLTGSTSQTLAFRSQAQPLFRVLGLVDGNVTFQLAPTTVADQRRSVYASFGVTGSFRS